ncbi:hypothetical protein [Anaerovibrio sp. RM50]|uniref:hypothetical protein n=1 Tax=Anaerovibrio sp. RM50 TaxID=1200557 RepID=UPI0012EC6BE2|nr:hypothetical protein [Anaerovibrio sp. RM50]
MSRNKLAPDEGGILNKIVNFGLSFGIAVVWLLKSVIKLAARPFVGKGKQQ